MSDGDLTTESPGLARKLGQFEIENIWILLARDERLQFYVPKRWWASERFDIHPSWVPPKPPGKRKDFFGPHLEVNVGENHVKWFAGTRVMYPDEVAIAIECLGFARAVLQHSR